jgi:hypothetical protein
MRIMVAIVIFVIIFAGAVLAQNKEHDERDGPNGYREQRSREYRHERQREEHRRHHRDGDIIDRLLHRD